MEVTYIDHMGDDLRVVNAARVSFAKESEWISGDPFPSGSKGIIEPSKVLSEGDIKLIKYLAKHNHWTPFSHVQITLREKVPIFVARQRFKHMVGFTYNEVSRRYVDDAPEFFFPETWRKRAENKKQGSSDEVITELKHEEGHEDLWGDIDNKWHPNMHVNLCYDNCLWMYNHLLDSGVAPEQARMVLPQSLFTEYYVTGSLAAWARAYRLRSESHAQKEIQSLAEHWNRVISGIGGLEHSWNALIG